MSEQIFENYESAHAHSLTVPWELKLCNTGESCWCRIIVPTKPIRYKDKIGDTERISEIDYIIPDGSIDKETAEYFIKVHNEIVNFVKQDTKNCENSNEINNKMLQVSKSLEKRLEALQELNDLDQELGFQ